MEHKTRGWIGWLYLIFGMVLTAAPFPLLFVPNDIAPGGITGVATLIHKLVRWPVGLLAALLNVPLFAVSWRRLGRGFAIRSLIATLGVSLLIDIIPYRALTPDPILAAVFGGVIMGAGLGLLVRGGATSGGTDMAAMLLHEKLPFLSVGGVLLALDCCVIIASGFVFDIQSAMYSLISIFLTTQVMNRVLEGFESAKAFFVCSDHANDIAQTAMDTLGRGATLLHAKGAYRQQECDMLLCVVSRLQVPAFKRLVKDMDPAAFVVVTDVREALGEGFTRPIEKP